MANSDVPRLIPMNGPAPPPGFPPWADPAALPDLKLQKTYAYQYQGYPGYAACMASSNEFFILRRLARLNARYLLYLQLELARLEQQIDAYVTMERRRPPGEGANGSFDQEQFPHRTRLIQISGVKLKEYYDLINAYTQVRCKGTADSVLLSNLTNWFRTYKNAIHPSEQHHLDANGDLLDGDLFPVIPTQRSPLRRLLEESACLRRCFSLRDRSAQVHTLGVAYYSDASLDVLVCAVMVAGAQGLLFAPIWWLHFAPGASHFGIVTSFTSVFAAWLWVAAGPREFEILLGAAAYAAALCFYLQARLVQSQTGQGPT